MFLGVTSVAFFVTGVQSAVTSYETCTYYSVDGTCKNELTCIETCQSSGTENICPYYTCDCMEDAFDITFGECANLYGMDQELTCIEDGTDPELYGGVNICSIVPSTSDSDDSPTEPEPEPSDNSPTPEPSVDSPTPEPSHAPTYAPSYAPCENFGLCETHCRGGNGACTADSCTTSG